MIPFCSQFVRILLFSLVLFSRPVEAAEETRKHVTVEVRQGEVFVEGRRVTAESALADYEALIGKPDRVTNARNTIYTYDALGIELYQAPGEKTIDSITLDLVGRKFQFSPKETFKGVLIVDNQVLRRDSARAEVEKIASLKFDPARNPRGFGVAHATQQKVVLILEYLESPLKLEGVGISWQDK